MPGHRISNDFARANALQELVIQDPGAGGTFDLNGNWWSRVNVTATGTYTLPNADAGTQLLVCCDDTSTVTLADAAGTFHIFTGTSGTTAVLCTASDSNSWSGTRLTRNTVNSAHDASEISYADSEGKTDATELDAAVTELYVHTLTAQGHVDIPLSCFREVDADGDVGNLAAVGGILASDSTPIFEGAGTTNAQRINWATGNVDRIAASVTLPPDFDDTADCTVDVIVASGTTNDFDATVVTNWNGGADVTDTIVDTGSATVHASSATVAAADIPASSHVVSVSFTPPAHATDAYHLYGVRLRYQKKLLTS